MSPGQKVDKAWGSANRAGGMLGQMIVKKKITRSTLLSILAELETSARLVREVIGGVE